MNSMLGNLLIFSLMFVQPAVALGERLPAKGSVIECTQQRRKPNQKKPAPVPTPTPSPSPRPIPLPSPALPFGPPTANPPVNDEDSGGPTACQSSFSLSGTYRLDIVSSDNTRAAIEKATSGLVGNDRQAVFQQLVKRFNSPEVFAIALCDRSVTMASTLAPQITFEADGREYRELSAAGRPVNVRASLGAEQLVVTSTGDRSSDFKVIIEPLENGRRLRLTRSINSESLGRQVVVSSIYDRISAVAQWNLYGNIFENSSSPTSTSGSNESIVPNGAELIAILDNDLSTKRSRNGDRFTMTLRAPAQYAGAIIEGYVSNLDRISRSPHGAGMTLNFEQMRLPDGRTYMFSGVIQSIRTPNGETVEVSDARNDKGIAQTDDRRVSRSTPISKAANSAGVEDDMAIGARSNTGESYVYVIGRDVLNLTRGSEVTLRAAPPR